MRPRFSWRPYVLRAFFDTQLLIAESRGKIAHDFRVFFMGHKGSIEAKYTANKGILPAALISEMREAFKRRQEFLDLEISEDVLEKQKEEVRSRIEQMSPEELAKVQELVRGLTGGNTEASSGSQPPMKQNSSSEKDGSSSELYPMARSSSGRMIRQNSISGLGGIRTHDLQLSPIRLGGCRAFWRPACPYCATSPTKTLSALL